MEQKEKNEKEKMPREKSVLREIMEWIFCLVAALVVAVIIKYFIFTPTLVQQSSMKPTILNGERVLINRLVRTFHMPIERGNIVTFESPDFEAGLDGKAKYNDHTGVWDFVLHDLLEITKTSYIKRVIGLPGDHVKIEEGNVYVNDQELNEVYLSDDVDTPLLAGSRFYDLVVPEGYIFVMGDNRAGSSDSRIFGCVPLEKVEGRVTYRIWPLDKFGKIDK